MRRTKSKSKQLDEYRLFKKLDGYAKSVSEGKIRKGNYFSLCVRAAFVKCYEFNFHAWDEKNSATAFFWLPTLRGICEDLIVLNYIQLIPKIDREPLILDLMMHEVQDRTKIQETFFKKTRPQQPCLAPNASAEQLADLENRVRQVWRAHGWSNMTKNVRPPTRQIAEKHGGEVLAVLYDYLYRLTSDTVHFSVRGLLRMGWGNLPHSKFSTTNLNMYYVTFVRIYGAFMFCSYFELLFRFLRPDKKTKLLVGEIRQSILKRPRWPEMITFEEMNVSPPKISVMQIALSLMQSETKKYLLK